MNTKRLSFAELTDGLQTKSDKIRALARSGYSRVEITGLAEVRKRAEALLRQADKLACESWKERM